MKNEDILKQAIEKAVKNGYDMFGLLKLPLAKWQVDTVSPNYVLITVKFAKQESIIKEGYKEVYINDIIFSHDFAKAFWGEEEICPDCGKKEECYCTNLDLYMFPRKEKEWEFHLQVMVLEKDPIQYLKKFI